MFQVRLTNGEIRNFDTLQVAVEYAAMNGGEKVSFSLPTQERVRIIFENGNMILEDIFGCREPIQIRF